MIEVRFLQAFLNKGVSWKTIRIASERAKEVLGARHPFSHRKFSTDGRNILAELARAEDDPVLLDLVRDQYELNRLVSQHLFGEIDFGPDDAPSVWYPLGKSQRVVVDPRRALGAPIIASVGIPTAVLAQSAEAEGSVTVVADMFGIEVADVLDAVNYETSRSSR
ncbi:MAG TPA: hypothetical protein PK788_00295 [Gemmatimonadaceae bacterium]|nr:hypothetical protein [Gemmatimonadaceae bacterium]HRQ77521.1 hypothetical protein [Gemmatimonadaceae bacterium]